MLCLLVTQFAFVHQAPVQSHRAVFDVVPRFDYDLQVADRPELSLTDPHIRWNNLIGPILMHTLLQICSLLAAQFERVVALSLRFQRQALLLIFVRPVPNSAVTVLHQTPNVLGGHAARVQTHRLQASQFVDIARLPFGLLKGLYLFFRQVKLSFSHTSDYISGDFFSFYPLGKSTARWHAARLKCTMMLDKDITSYG